MGLGRIITNIATVASAHWPLLADCVFTNTCGHLYKGIRNSYCFTPPIPPVLCNTFGTVQQSRVNISVYKLMVNYLLLRIVSSCTFALIYYSYINSIGFPSMFTVFYGNLPALYSCARKCCYAYHKVSDTMIYGHTCQTESIFLLIGISVYQSCRTVYSECFCNVL